MIKDRDVVNFVNNLSEAQKDKLLYNLLEESLDIDIVRFGERYSRDDVVIGSDIYWESNGESLIYED